MTSGRTKALMLAVVAGYDRESLGRFVRGVWDEWAREQPTPKASWLVPWDDLTEPDKEVDRRIGEALYRMGLARASEERVLLLAIEKAAERSLYVRPINPSAKWAADLALHNAIAAHARWKVAPIPGER